MLAAVPSREAVPAACPACVGILEPWRAVPASEPGVNSQWFDLLRCESCGTAVTAGQAWPELNDSGAFRPGVPRLYRLASPLLHAYDAQRLALLRTLVASGARVLDAGAGQGRFVVRAREAGYDAFGIEPSTRGVQRAAALGAPVLQVGLEQAELDADSLDAVTLWHVLEHLEDPRLGLERISEWVRPGGGLLVGVPNLASVQASIGGERWYHLDVPRHRTHFTPEGIRRLLHATGFDVVSTEHALLEHNAFGMWQSAVNRFTTEPSYLYNLLKRNVPLGGRDLALTFLALPLLPVAALAELGAAFWRRGGTVAVLARRAA
jgi:2-polyprenyl-3-methyl-5-hydroxy-6-metoxy-1,4-benzoquinol methylase